MTTLYKKKKQIELGRARTGNPKTAATAKKLGAVAHLSHDGRLFAYLIKKFLHLLFLGSKQGG